MAMMAVAAEAIPLNRVWSFPSNIVLPKVVTYDHISAITLDHVRQYYLIDNFFKDSPFQARLRKSGVLDTFRGGSGMMEGFIVQP